MLERQLSDLLESSNPSRRAELLQNAGIDYLRVAEYPDAVVSEIMGRIQSGDKEIWRANYLAETKEGWAGWGMDTFDAFKCLIDVHRTSLLIDGIQSTIERVVAQRGGPIRAIDAGTGTGILAMTLAMHPAVEKVIALEINPNTAKVAHDFIAQFGLSDKVQVIECDATQVDLGDYRADILVSENLSSALFDEPQFHIINHLSRFLTTDAKILPYSAKTYVYLGNSAWQGIQADKSPAARLLTDLVKLSQPAQYYEVTSEKDMEVPHIRGEVETTVDTQVPINTLLVCADFQIDEGPNPHILYHDTAEFLGKSGALRIEGEVEPKDGQVTISLQYPAGMSRGVSVVTASGSHIALRPPVTI